MSRIIRPLSRALALTSLLLALPAFAGEKRTVVNPYGTPERITTWKLNGMKVKQVSSLRANGSVMYTERLIETRATPGQRQVKSTFRAGGNTARSVFSEASGGTVSLVRTNTDPASGRQMVETIVGSPRRYSYQGEAYVVGQQVSIKEWRTKTNVLGVETTRESDGSKSVRRYGGKTLQTLAMPDMN